MIDPKAMPANLARAHAAPKTLRAPGAGPAVTAQAISHDNLPSPQIPDAKPKEQAGALEQDHEGEAPSPGRPLVRFTLRRVRLLDADAKWGSVKDALDGLHYAGIICGDREDQITLEVTQERVRTFKEEETLIEVHNPDGPATEDAP